MFIEKYYWGGFSVYFSGKEPIFQARYWFLTTAFLFAVLLILMGIKHFYGI